MYNRRSFFRGSGLVLSAAALGGGLAACSQTSTGGGDTSDGGGGDLLSKLQDAGKITVGFAGEAPYSFDDNGELTGATVAMHREIFGELGIDEVEGKLTDWNSLIPGLNSSSSTRSAPACRSFRSAAPRPPSASRSSSTRPRSWCPRATPRV